MEKSSALSKLVSLVLISMLVNSPQSGAITCDEVRTDVLPCVPYIMAGGSQVPPGCCDGIKTVMNKASTTADRQNVCSCMKAAAASATDDQIKRAAAIPGLCGVPVSFNISRDVDCSKVK